MIFVFEAVKSLNNNLVLAVKDGKEFILLGKGIGFNSKKGDQIQLEQVEKLFYTQNDQLYEWSENVDSKVFEVTEKILRIAEKELDQTLNPGILFSLADYISYTVERIRNNIYLEDNTLQWEVPFLYPQEYEIGKKASKEIEKAFMIKLQALESSLIALQFINAQQEISSKAESMLTTKIIQNITSVIESLFRITLNQESLSYFRFVIHIRHFMNRESQVKKTPSMGDNSLYDILSEKYTKSYACSLVVRDLLRRNYNLTVNDEELVFLMIHIQQLISENKLNK